MAKSQKLAISLVAKPTTPKTSDTLTRSLSILMKMPPSEKQEKIPTIDPLAEALLRVADMAVMWWIGRRPTVWSLEQHIHGPTVGCVTTNDKNLAFAVAKWCDFQRRKKHEEDKQGRMATKRSA